METQHGELTAVLAALQIEVYFLDEDGLVVAAAPRNANALGAPFANVVPHDDRPRWLQTWQSRGDENASSQMEFATADKRGPRTKRVALQPADSSGYRAIVIDVTDDKEVAASLHRFETIFDRAAWGIAIAIGNSTTLDFVNPLFADMHGYTIAEISGMEIAKIFPPAHRSEIESHRQRVHESGHASFETWHLRKDGTKFPVRVNAMTVADDAGQVQFRAALVQDISQEHAAAETLRFTNAILKTQQELSPDGILIVDERGAVVSYNARFVEMWKIPPAVIASGRDQEALDHVLELVEDPDEFQSRVEYLYSHPDKTSFETIRLRDGRIFDRHSAAMSAANGRRYGRVWFFRDVTEQRNSEQAVRESEDRLTRIIDTAMDAIIVIDTQRRVRVFNTAAEGIFGVPTSEATKGTIDRFLSAPFRELLSDCLAAFAQRGTQNRYMWLPRGLKALRADGDEFAVEATISAVAAESQQLLTIILRDVNERDRAAEQIESLSRENVLLKESLAARTEFAEIIGSSAAIQRVIAAVRQVAPTEASVLITGETGTGKGLVARAIQQASDRADNVFINVNCAALPETLIESELFGHEAGAFTGAVGQKIGRFEAADRGTIFLDEIGDLPLGLQAKLLRVLQDGELERIGGTETLRVDVRVIAATNRDVSKEIERGAFRADLFYRLNVFPIEVPPLRERLSDVPALAEAFAARYAARLRKEIHDIPAAVLERLTAYDWPGNIRELQNVIERAVILAQSNTLQIGDWLPAASNETVHDDQQLELADVERAHIIRVLEMTGGRVSGPQGAAKQLGMKPTTLESRMKKLGIRRTDIGPTTERGGS